MALTRKAYKADQSVHLLEGRIIDCLWIELHVVQNMIFYLVQAFQILLACGHLWIAIHLRAEDE